MNIRTHTTTVDSFGGLDDMGPGWEPGTPVMVVAGLPEGSELRRLCDVPEGWEVQGKNGEWFEMSLDWVDYPGLVVCRPRPVPAPPATDGTAPTPDLTPLFLALKNYESAHPGVVLHGAWRKVNAAVRALRDGGTR